MIQMNAVELMDTAWRWRRESFDWPLAARYSRLQAARQLLNQAIIVALTNGDDRNVAQAIHLLANLDYDVGRLDSAEQLWRLAVELCRELNDPPMLAHKIRHLGDLNKLRNQLEDANHCYEESLALYRKMGNKDNNTNLDLANLLIRFAEIKLTFMDSVTSVEYLSEAEALYQKLKLSEGAEYCREQIEQQNSKS